MTRTVSSVVAVAVAQDATKPIYLIRMGWDVQSPDVERRIATWDQNISWNSETWTASGAAVEGIGPARARLVLPVGASDPWLSLVQTQVPRDRTVEIYEYHTSTASPSGSDAELLFTGYMDDASIDEREIQINLIEGKTNKGFPPTSIGPPTYNYLVPAGSRLFWGPDIVTFN